ncbi:MAG: hypothetical protein DMF38_13230 [Verrucomicrobia bacterium]|nr:MAG: hypothetical protein DMF38_13230 [Verrucomicrobiota bacterium]
MDLERLSEFEVGCLLAKAFGVDAYARIAQSLPPWQVMGEDFRSSLAKTFEVRCLPKGPLKQKHPVGIFQRRRS